jgi:hypothetical protein
MGLGDAVKTGAAVAGSSNPYVAAGVAIGKLLPNKERREARKARKEEERVSEMTPAEVAQQQMAEMDSQPANPVDEATRQRMMALLQNPNGGG